MHTRTQMHVHRISATRVRGKRDLARALQAHAPCCIDIPTVLIPSSDSNGLLKIELWVYTNNFGSLVKRPQTQVISRSQLYEKYGADDRLPRHDRHQGGGLADSTSNRGRGRPPRNSCFDSHVTCSNGFTNFVSSRSNTVA